MKLDILPLTEENLREAPEWNSHPFGCKYCLYWKFPEEFFRSRKKGEGRYTAEEVEVAESDKEKVW